MSVVSATMKGYLHGTNQCLMKVVILGATGFSGTAILKEVLGKGHQVTVLVRDASKLKRWHQNLRVVEGDVLDRNKLSEVLENQDAVIQCLGIGGKGDGKKNTFISNATRIVVDEMERRHVPRLVALSNVGAGNSISFLPTFFSKFILPYFMKWLQAIIDDKNRMEPFIMNSRLKWTIVRCPNIVDKPSRGKCRATLDGEGLKLSVTLPDLALFIAEQIEDKTYSGQAPSVSN